jgi:hypothetical protein
MITNDCWHWFGAKREGYGRLWNCGRVVQAHRYYYEKYVGEIPEGLCVLHRCDNPSCVNPSHLFLGTKKDNTQDALKKGRLKCRWPKLYGEQHPQHKLTWDQVREVRKRYSLGRVTQRQLAKEFSVDPMTICNVVNGKIWVK